MSRENDEVGGDGVNSSYDSPSFNPLATPTLGKVSQVESDRLDSVSSDADARTLSNGNQESKSKQQVASEDYAKHRVAPVTDSVSAEHQGKSTGSLPVLVPGNHRRHFVWTFKGNQRYLTWPIGAGCRTHRSFPSRASLFPG